uniref:Matrix protein n=1 Tax=Ferlavirus reptilis TaxID=3052205 RepID=A0A2P1GN08_9MONO|nr:matrix protein [Fer-de-lance virus]
MGTIAEFNPLTWAEHGSLSPMLLEQGPDKKIIPQYRFIAPKAEAGRTKMDWYLTLSGIIECKSQPGTGVDTQPTSSGKKIVSMGMIPLGVGHTKETPDALLEAVVKLKITVRRTARSSETLIFTFADVDPRLAPWNYNLKSGMGFPSMKVSSQAHLIPVDQRCTMRGVFLIITALGAGSYYKIPRPIQNLTIADTISVNFLVGLTTDGDLSKAGLMSTRDSEGHHTVETMIHLGIFKRTKGKSYTVEYCQTKVLAMDLTFALAGVGGVSLHVIVNGKISKQLLTQLAGHRSICYSLMDINPKINSVLWRPMVEISYIKAVFQPSIPKEFKIYSDVIVKKAGRVQQLMKKGF